MTYSGIPSSFQFKNREEVQLFEEYLESYVLKLTNRSLDSYCLPLLTVYDQIQQRENMNQIFSALIDLKLSFLLVLCDSHMITGYQNSSSSSLNSEISSVLYSETTFFEKMQLHRYSTSYVLRYRALWDKIMGFLILILSPNISDYQRFIDAKSKKKAFKKIALNIQQIPQELAQQIEVFLTNFDDMFRTAEAHGAGVLRKYTFLMEPAFTNPQIDLTIGYWNFVNETVIQISKILENINLPDSLKPLKLIRAVHFVSFVNFNRIKIYAEDIQKQKTIKECTLLVSVVGMLECLFKIKTYQKSFYIPGLAANFHVSLEKEIPNLFDESFWISNAKLILNNMKAWEIDKSILEDAPPVIASPLGFLEPKQLEKAEEVESFMIGIASYQGAREIWQKLNLNNAPADKLESLLMLSSN